MKTKSTASTLTPCTIVPLVSLHPLEQPTTALVFQLQQFSPEAFIILFTLPSHITKPILFSYNLVSLKFCLKTISRLFGFLCFYLQSLCERLVSMYKHPEQVSRTALSSRTFCLMKILYTYTVQLVGSLVIKTDHT